VKEKETKENRTKQQQIASTSKRTVKDPYEADGTHQSP
jgi:hypothetical protein